MVAVDGGAAVRRPFIARWDLDKTYLRTDFETLRDLWRTAIERPDQKRTVPGAASLLRELGRAGVEIHILSGSPEQLRGRLEEKLRLDGARWASLTLKPNLQNLVRFRFRAIRSQLGYKLPALLLRRCELPSQRDPSGELIREVLLGDDAEADAFVYSLYADICAGTVSNETVAEVLRQGGAYDDTIEDALRFASYIEKGPIVERILIHLDRQSSPSDFAVYGERVVPFYNYLQAAFILCADSRLPARAVLRVAQELVVAHNFDSAALARSYADLSRRGHLPMDVASTFARAYEDLLSEGRQAGASDLGALVAALSDLAPPSRHASHSTNPPDYRSLVAAHNQRTTKKR